MAKTYSSNTLRAAAAIDATELPDGRWAHYDNAVMGWFVVSGEQLGELVDYLDHSDPAIASDAYSHWCAGTSAEQMPSGWSPEAEAVAKTQQVIVKADPDADDCLAAAAENYLAQHSNLRGWELCPRWVDDNNREEIVLTVPVL